MFKLLADCSTVAEGTLSQHAQAPDQADDANTGPATSLSVLLVTYPYPGHLIPTAALGEELVRRGHNVSLCTTILHMDGALNMESKVAERSGLNLLSAGSDFIV